MFSGPVYSKVEPQISELRIVVRTTAPQYLVVNSEMIRDGIINGFEGTPNSYIHSPYPKLGFPG